MPERAEAFTALRSRRTPSLQSKPHHEPPIDLHHLRPFPSSWYACPAPSSTKPVVSTHVTGVRMPSSIGRGWTTASSVQPRSGAAAPPHGATREQVEKLPDCRPVQAVAPQRHRTNDGGDQFAVEWIGGLVGIDEEPVDARRHCCCPIDSRAGAGCTSSPKDRLKAEVCWSSHAVSFHQTEARAVIKTAPPPNSPTSGSLQVVN